MNWCAGFCAGYLDGHRIEFMQSKPGKQKVFVSVTVIERKLFDSGFAELIHDNFNGSRKEGPRHWLQLLGTEPVEASFGATHDSYPKCKANEEVSG